MATKPRDDKEKSKIRSHFYSVSIKTDKSRKKDNKVETEKKIGEIKTLAASAGFEDAVKIRQDDETMLRLGIFFMNAPEKFAEKVKKLDGIKQVTKPAEKKTKKGRGRGR